MRSKFHLLKTRAIVLRRLGKTYGEIFGILGERIPKSTLSGWCRGVELPKGYQKRVEQIIVENIKRVREKAMIANRLKKEKYLATIKDRTSHLAGKIIDKDIAKIALAMLYLGEGGKSLGRGALLFGNSDPFIISLFLYLLRYCYDIDERKFRCTLQCRADQNVKTLERFWLGVTKIPSSQFYKARIDPRTIGKPTKKPDYKGVCRIDYLSTDLFLELMQIPKTIYKEGP